jgi:hypothetical protein
MSFLVDGVMKFLGYRAMRMFTYHVSFFSLSGCHGTPISHVIYHNPLQTVITFIAVRLEMLWAIQPRMLSGTVLPTVWDSATNTFQNPKLLVDS